MGSLTLISFIFLSLQISMGWATFANRCPQPDSIYPGECRVGQLASKLSLSIWSKPDSPQELIDRMFIRAREANGATSNDTLECHNLSTRFVDFENGAWNLTSLDRTSFVFMDIENSNDFSSVSDGPREESSGSTSKVSQPATRIRVEYLYLKQCAQVGDQTLRDFLKYVDPGALIMLQMTGGSLYTFPFGLLKFPKLATLDFTGNKFRGIRSHEVQGLVSLTSVILKSNQIGVIEENGLYFEPETIPISDGKRRELREKVRARTDRLSITFEWNQLTSEGIHENHGLDSTNYRPITLTLSGNNLTSLPEGTWRKFLEAHDENLLAVASNPLVCGQGTRWLKENRQQFENKVQGANCENDPGNNVFTTNL